MEARKTVEEEQTTEPETLDEAKEQIQQLRKELVTLKQSAVYYEDPNVRHSCVGRMTIRSIVDREDKGTGLVGQTIIVAGWIRTIRIQGKGELAFVHLNDGSSFSNIQVVVDGNRPGFAELSESSCNTGASVWAKGRLVASLGKGQKVELLAVKVGVLGQSDPLQYPLAKKEHTVEHLRKVAHLRPRTILIGSVARVRNALAYATHKFFQEKGFVNLHTPVITASDCEGAGEMFQVTTLLKDKVADIPVTPDGKTDFSRDFFGRPAYLTVSGQLNAEQYACALSNVYTFGPTFRAEDSNTTRHLAEFWMIEPEMAFCDLEDNMNLAEEYLKYAIAYALKTCPQDMAYFDKQCKGSLITRLRHVLDTPFKRVTYTEAVELLIKSGKKFEVPVEWGIDLGSEHERFLTEQILKMPVIVTDYPKQFKAFYMRVNEDGRTVRAMDILVPKIGEIIGGSQREERLDVLLQSIAEKNLDEENYSTYLDLRRFGGVPHSGFGLGFERLILFTTGVENIRDVIPFPRWPKHADF